MSKQCKKKKEIQEKSELIQISSVECSTGLSSADAADGAVVPATQQSDNDHYQHTGDSRHSNLRN